MRYFKHTTGEESKSKISEILLEVKKKITKMIVE